MNNKRIRFELKGENQIELKTLKRVINSFDACFVADTEKLKKSERPEVKVEISKGSIIIDFLITVGAGAVLLGLEHGVPKLIKYFKYRKHLGGMPPKDVRIENNTTTIINNYGNMIVADTSIVEQYFTNSTIEPTLAKMSKSFMGDSTRQGFVVSEIENEQIIDSEEYTPQDVNATSSIVDFSSLIETRIEIIKHLRVMIDKNYLVGDGQWGLITLHNNDNIDVTIKDEDFLRKYHNGQIEVKGGAKMFVDLECTNRFNRANKQIGKTAYAVLRAEIIPTIQAKNVSMF